MFAELRNDLIISFLPPANRFEFSQEKRKLSNCHTTQPTSYLLFNLGGTLSLKLSGHFRLIFVISLVPKKILACLALGIFAKISVSAQYFLISVVHQYFYYSFRKKKHKITRRASIEMSHHAVKYVNFIAWSEYRSGWPAHALLMLSSPRLIACCSKVAFLL